jgi:hypothetical protein
MRCAMTDHEHPELSDGAWDDDEWIKIGYAGTKSTHRWLT